MPTRNLEETFKDNREISEEDIGKQKHSRIKEDKEETEDEQEIKSLRP